MFYWDEGLNESTTPPSPAQGVTCWVMIILAFAAFFWAAGAKPAKGAESSEVIGPQVGLVQIRHSFQAVDPLDRQVKEFRSYGSGVCIHPEGWILTNCHVVSEANAIGEERIDVAKVNHRSTLATVELRDSSADLAVLKPTEPVEFDWRPVAETAPIVGDPVWSEGYPAREYAILSGRVKEFRFLNLAREEDRIRYPGVDIRRTPATICMLDYHSYEGNSGGPVCNSQGEVVALVQGTWNRDALPEAPFDETFAVGLPEIHRAIQVCGIKKPFRKFSDKRPKAYFIWGKNCPPCHEFPLDYGGKNQAKHPPRSPELRRVIDQYFRLRSIRIDNAKRLCKKFGITQTPAFIVACYDKPIIGYYGPEDLIKKIQSAYLGDRNSITTATEFGNDPDGIPLGPDDFSLCQADAFFNNDPDFFAVDIQEGGELAQASPERRPLIPNPFKRTPQVRQDPATPPVQRPPPRPAPQAAPIDPTPPEEELEGYKMESAAEETEDTGDLSEVTAVVLVKKSVPGIAGKLVGYVEEHASGKLTDAINSALADKAAIRVIFERANPSKYAAVVEAAGLSGESLGEIILVAPKKFSGLAGTLVSKVESALEGLKHSALKKLPVSAVFERTEEESYADVVAALGSADNGGMASDDGIFSGGAKSQIFGSLFGQSTLMTGLFLFLWRKITRTEKKADKAVAVIKEV